MRTSDISSESLKALLDHVAQAQAIGATLGLPNILQPGLLKELVIANHLGHSVISTKHDADACDPADLNRLFEYLSCMQGGSFQMDRMFSRPPEKRERSLERLRRNAFIYCAIFDKSAPLTLLELYEVDVDVAVAERQLDASSNDISHLAFGRKWARTNGRQVLPRG